MLNKNGSNHVCRQCSAEHWVASIPKGKTEADRLAEEHGLRNAGEVLPDSNVFYFKLPRDTDRRRRKRRAAGAADLDVLLRHSDVEFLEKQTEQLTRVKRVPIPQEDAGMQIYQSFISFLWHQPTCFSLLNVICGSFSRMVSITIPFILLALLLLVARLISFYRRSNQHMRTPVCRQWGHLPLHSRWPQS